MKLILRFFAVLGSLVVAGCVVQQSMPFNESDFQAFKGSGLSSVTGHAFLKTPDGHVVSVSGCVVELTPTTPYTKERYDIARSGRSAEDPDSRLAQYVRTAVGDFQGNFAFRGLPPGQYLLSCTITRYVPTPYQVTMSPRSDETFESVAVAPGESANVVLTISE